MREWAMNGQKNENWIEWVGNVHGDLYVVDHMAMYREISREQKPFASLKRSSLSDGRN